MHGKNKDVSTALLLGIGICVLLAAAFFSSVYRNSRLNSLQNDIRLLQLQIKEQEKIRKIIVSHKYSELNPEKILNLLDRQGKKRTIVMKSRIQLDCRTMNHKNSEQKEEQGLLARTYRTILGRDN